MADSSKRPRTEAQKKQVEKAKQANLGGGAALGSIQHKLFSDEEYRKKLGFKNLKEAKQFLSTARARKRIEYSLYERWVTEYRREVGMGAGENE